MLSFMHHPPGIYVARDKFMLEEEKEEKKSPPFEPSQMSTSDIQLVP